MTKTLSPELETLLVELEHAWDARRSGGARPRRAVAARVAIACAAAAAVVVVTLVRTSGPAAVSEAIAALGDAPANVIVHFTSVSHNPGGALTQRTEMWASTQQPYAERSILEGPDGEPIEQGAAGDRVTQYDPTGIVYVRVRDGGIAEGNHPADFAPNVDAIRTYLRSSAAEDDGVVGTGRARVHRFTIAVRGGGTCVYDVDADDFYARSLVCTGLSSGSIEERWEYLPRQGNESLLSVAAQHPDARLDVAPLGTCGPARHTASTPPCVVDAPGA